MKILILGSAQDAGLPQIGCNCTNCQKGHKNISFRRFASSLAILNEENGSYYLIDASPDIKYQNQIIIELQKKKRSDYSISFLKGIFLTHTHFGHISGLWSFGKECLDSKEINVYCTPKMKDFLETNHPFKHLISQGNLKLKMIQIGKEVMLDAFKIRSFEVTHRNEYADTIGYLISNEKKVIYLPDLDYWTKDIIDLVNTVDIAIIDGTFYTKDEISKQKQVPHPPIIESIEIFANSKTEIYFTHFNHTNPIVGQSKEKDKTMKKGFKIAQEGMLIEF